MPATRKARRRQLNVRIDSNLYKTLESLARHERRSVPQVAKRLLERGVGGRQAPDEFPATGLAAWVVEAGAFDWLKDEPDLYDDDSGEPV